MQKILIIAAAALALMGGGYAYYAKTNATTTQMTQITPVAGEVADIDTSIVKEMAIGNPDAKVTVIEYGSFTCPHCAAFNQSVYKEIKTNYIDTGKINFIHREVYFDRFGLWAGMVARCGGDTRYFGITDMLYSTQKTWLGSGTPAGIADALKKIGRTAGISNDELDACFNDATKAEAMYALYQKQTQEDDVTGTPTFIINGQKYSNMGYEEFAKTLDEKLAE